MSFESFSIVDDPDRVSEIHRLLVTYPGDDMGRISFTDVVENEFGPGVLAQYVAYYIDGFNDYPILAEGLDIIGDVDNWRSLMIEPDDALILKEKIQKYRSEKIAGAIGKPANNLEVI
jgi:hypothetical protein